MLKGLVGLPMPIKETHFFDWHYRKGLDWYMRRFAHNPRELLLGEICNYFPARLAAERIKLHIPECRIICSLRDPVERTYSAYKFAIYNGLTRDPFERALDTNRSMTVGNLYARHLATWYEKFGRERVLVVLFDEIRTDPQGYLDKVCDFIGIPRIDAGRVRLPAKAINSHSMMPRVPMLARKARRAINWLNDRGYKDAVRLLDSAGIWNLCFNGRFPPMAAETEARLRERYLPEIEAAETLSGVNLGHWKRNRTEGPVAV
jgi:hypothetical protein